MKDMNSNKKIIILISLVLAVVFLVSFSALKRNETKETGVVQSSTNDFVGTVDKIVSAPVKAISNLTDSIGNLFNTFDENARLKKRLDSYAVIQGENENFKKENKDLKNQLEMSDSLSSYEKITGSVISRSPDTWQNILIIDKGKDAGVEVDMPVMGSEGLIGRIIEVNKLSSKVELLTSNNQSVNKYPVMISPDKGDMSYGLLASYEEKSGHFIVNQLTSLDGLKSGDKVTTSGLGGNSPSGLIVGEVVGIKKNGLGLDKEVYIKPINSMYDISFVTVIKRLAESEG
ncbi:rod shape-determining protein MreC [Vagococcus coleopterorum]|uniref:Cell shape-determining protein MreC n=2 Tax=Vagococcus coleopterorum TaxID=2714946 RepID=A0A6G8ALP9_9ENTE|nr:rod shape-determining protein MreC [Vagococcus coleopterorum]QIL45889.1 rod shape-determining protein MreC [Vagococcus coleopterorum]